MPRDASSAMAEPTVAILGTGRMGSAMAERLASQGVDGRRLQPDTGAGRPRWPSGSGRPSRPRRPRPRRRADVVDLDGRRRRRRARAVRRAGRGRRRASGRARSRSTCSTVLPDAIRSVAGAVRARGAGILDAPVSGSVSARRSPGELTIMVGGEAADLDAGTADPRPPRPTGLPPRPARDRRGDEARGQHPDLRAQRRGRRRPRPRRAERDRPGARLRRPRRERGRGALRRLQAATRS